MSRRDVPFNLQGIFVLTTITGGLVATSLLGYLIACRLTSRDKKERGTPSGSSSSGASSDSFQVTCSSKNGQVVWWKEENLTALDVSRVLQFIESTKKVTPRSSLPPSAFSSTTAAAAAADDWDGDRYYSADEADDDTEEEPGILSGPRSLDDVATDGTWCYKLRMELAGVSQEPVYRQHVFWLRWAFKDLCEGNDAASRSELLRIGEELGVMLLQPVASADDIDQFRRALAEFLGWLASNMDQARKDAALLKTKYLNVYDSFLEWILLDAFDDLANVPSALSTALYWTPAAMKHATVKKFADSALDAKIARASYAGNQFQERYYTFLRTLTPFLCVGFMNTDESIREQYTLVQQDLVDHLYRPLFKLPLSRLPDSLSGRERLKQEVMGVVRTASQILHEKIKKRT